MLTTMLVACGSSSSYVEYEEDNSWMDKEWNDLSGSEKEKANEYIRDCIEEKNAY